MSDDNTTGLDLSLPADAVAIDRSTLKCFPLQVVEMTADELIVEGKSLGLAPMKPC